MRFLALLTLLASPAGADTLATSGHITQVTVYDQGAQVTRDLAFTAQPGRHQLVIADLPAQIDAGLIRLAASPGASIGAWSLRTDRLPLPAETLTPDQTRATAAVDQAKAALRQAQDTIAAINARAEAAEAQATFLLSTKAEGGALTPEALTALSQTVASGVLAAKQAALAARADLPAAETARDTAQKALDRAEAALAALTPEAAELAALTVTVTAETTAEAHLTLTYTVAEAGWQPVYDLSLTRSGGNKLTIDRGLLVSQSSGEDWSQVALTLSTAQPGAQAAPSALYPDLRRLIDPEELAASERMASGAMDEAVMAAPVVEPMVVSPSRQGDVVIYAYPVPVDVASGAENLRLAFGQITAEPQVQARAVPRQDATAFVVARFANPSQEILLPGQALLLRDGNLVGSVWLDKLAPGAETDIAFGAIEGLLLTRDMPTRNEGDRGILSSDTERTETAVLKVRNLTEESWPIHLVDQVPYSEQEDLEISFTSDPTPTATDVDGQRGILAWEFTLPPGEETAVTLQTILRWPAGKSLQ